MRLDSSEEKYIIYSAFSQLWSFVWNLSYFFSLYKNTGFTLQQAKKAAVSDDSMYCLPVNDVAIDTGMRCYMILVPDDQMVTGTGSIT